MGEGGHIRLVSYNIHRCVGADGRHDPDRIAAVLREIDADVIALQEVDSSHWIGGGVDQLSALAEATGLEGVDGATLRSERGQYGNAVLTRLPVRQVNRHDLTVVGREPRGALEVVVESDGTRLGLLATHLGLRARERRRQLRSLAAIARESDLDRFVVLGDLNEWIPGALRPLHAALTATKPLRTFPARRPLLPLDRVWVRPSGCVRTVVVHRSATASVASDHLPIVVSMAL